MSAKTWQRRCEVRQRGNQRAIGVYTGPMLDKAVGVLARTARLPSPRLRNTVSKKTTFVMSLEGPLGEPTPASLQPTPRRSARSAPDHPVLTPCRSWPPIDRGRKGANSAVVKAFYELRAWR